MPLTGPPIDKPALPSDLLQAGLAQKPDDLAMVSSKTRWTWRELEQATNRLAAGLLDLGLEPGARVASFMPNRAVLLIHYMACLKAGLVAVPLNYRYMAPEIDHALEVSGAVALVAHAERAGDLAKSALVGRLPRGVISFGAEDDKGPSLEALLARDAPARSFAPVDPDAPACVFFTSGSTGRPKGVTHSQATFGWMLASAAAAFELTPDDILLPGSSVSHLGGFLFSFAALSVGARVAVARSIAGNEMIPLLRQTRPTVLCMLPTALLRLMGEPGITGEDFSSLRLCRGGADKVPAELERQFTALTGFPIDEGYGMSEVGLAALNPPSGLIKIGSVGRPIPGFRMSIRDEAGHELPPGEEGRLWMQSPSATVGYWERPEATAALYRDGWLDSGDLMRADEDGYLWFRGRKKQIIVHDGSNISPQEVEEALVAHPAVEGAGVVGVCDLVHGENVVAYLAFKSGAPVPSSHELIEFARARVGYKAPEEIVVLDEVPLNPTGKVDRVTLKRWAVEAHLADC